MKPLLYFCLSIYCVFVLTGCSYLKKKVELPEYGGVLLSKEEVIDKMGGDVDALKVIADVELEKADAHFEAKGSVLMKKPEMLNLKLYKLGFPIFALSIYDGMIQTNSNKEGEPYRELSLLLYQCLMWWDGLDDSQMFTSKGNYHFISPQRELIVNGKRLFPVQQKLFYKNRTINVFYENPFFIDDFWYPSAISVKISSNSFTLKIKKINVNPPIDDDSFVLSS